MSCHVCRNRKRQDAGSFCPEQQSYLTLRLFGVIEVIFVVILCVLAVLCVCIAVFFTLDAGLLARSHYSEGPATGHLDTGFSWFPCVYKQMLR